MGALIKSNGSGKVGTSEAGFPMPRALLVGLPTDSKPIGLHRYQAAGEKYVRALVDEVLAAAEGQQRVEDRRLEGEERFRGGLRG